ncbi:MAG: hypothetical protein K0R65_199 [Crocinitomicaceae bacterium]|jgi:hypothetical protein|nr:hypothetical protein [Crocinitomicaceae bacterium]
MKKRKQQFEKRVSASNSVFDVFLYAVRSVIRSFLPVVILFSGSCSVIQKTAKQELTDGVYQQKMDKKKETVYVNVLNENIRIYRVIKTADGLKVDTARISQMYSDILKTKEGIEFSLSKKSFDVDFLTIPLKYRTAQKSVAPQLNANFNGAVYLGYRTDRYVINYQSNPLHISERKMTHLGYSVGIFTGLGNTFMSPTNTNNALQQEYDAMVWNKGIAAIFGVNSFSLGFSVGFDNLLDQNRDTWIYESKPWLGLIFGLNLN